jgi:transposase
MMKIAIGMDLHKATAVCYAVFAGNGKASDREREFLDDFNRNYRSQASTPESMTRIAKALSDHDAYVLIENSTKTYETYWVLTNLGVNVVVAQSQDLYRITRSVKKTDKNDSMELAAYLRRYLHGEREFAVCTMPPKEWMMKREMCRTIFKEKAHLGDLKRRMRMHLLLHGIQLSREYSDIFSKKAINELSRLDDPVVKMILSEAVSLKRRNEEEIKLLRHLFQGNRMYELIQTIPAFGFVSAAYLTSMIMDLNRFRDRKMFTAYFGVVPKIRESSDVSHRCATTHRGDEEVRRLVMQAAFVHVNTVEDSMVKRMWDRLSSRDKAFREVQCACARKLLTVVWSVLKEDRPYIEQEEIILRSLEMSDALLEESDESDSSAVTEIAME